MAPGLESKENGRRELLQRKQCDFGNKYLERRDKDFYIWRCVGELERVVDSLKITFDENQSNQSIRVNERIIIAEG